MANRKKGNRILFVLFSIMLVVIYTLLLIGLTANYVPPRVVWWIPFTGFIFPYVYIIGLVLLTFSWRISRRVFVIQFIILLLCLPYALRFYPLNVSSLISGKKDGVYSIMSYNVRHFDRHGIIHQGDTTKNKIFEYIAEEKPDIICFQEYYKGRKKDPFVNSELIKEIGEFDYYVDNTIFETQTYRFGVSIFSKYPIINQGVVSSSSNKYFFNVFADIVIPKQDTIRVFNTHFESIRLSSESYALFENPSWKIEEQKSSIKTTIKKIKAAHLPRETQVNEIINSALESPYPVFVVGDFNEPPISYTYQRFKQHFQDHYLQSFFGTGATYVGDIPAGRIDYIFSTPKKIIPEGFSIQKKVLSDHRAIKAYFSLLSN